MSKQYSIMSPDETSYFIAFDRMHEAEKWIEDNQRFIQSETSYLYGAHIVEQEKPPTQWQKVCAIVEPMAKAALDRKLEIERGLVLNCSRCNQSPSGYLFSDEPEYYNGPQAMCDSCGKMTECEEDGRDTWNGHNMMHTDAAWIQLGELMGVLDHG